MRGIINVLNTPFTENDEIDVESLGRNVRRAFKAGVAGFLVPALAGEVGKLTMDERLLLVKTTLETVRAGGGAQGSDTRPGPGVSSVPVIGGATAADRETRLRAAEALIGLGCDGVLVAIPYTSDGEYEKSVREVADLKPGFLMLQDWDPSGYGLPVPLIVRLFEEIEVFKCLKIETVPAGVKYSEVLATTGGNLHVSGGWAVGQMIEGLDRGVHAFMPTGMVEIYCTIYRRYTSGDRVGAVELFRKILPVLAFSNQHLDISVHFFKRLLHGEGVYATSRVRQPILPFDEYHERTAAELIGYVMKLAEVDGRSR
jgi:4-hydroxy-tetrahydrodipicolinate synthase